MTLWMTPSLRYFLVPDDFGWPPGDTVVNDVLGQTRRVDPGAIAPHEVPPERARVFAEADTRRIEAELDAIPRDTPDPVLRERIQALADRAGGLDTRIRDALAAIGLPVERLVADPEQTIHMWAEITATVALANDRAAKERLQGRIEAILARNGYPEAARKLRTAPAKVRKWAEGMQKAEAEMNRTEKTREERIHAVLEATRASLTEAQAASVRGYLRANEPLLALEFLVDFLVDNEATVTPAINTEILALLASWGSDRAGDGLPTA